MLPRRGSPPPYEIMGRNGNRAGGRSEVREPEPRADRGGGGGGGWPSIPTCGRADVLDAVTAPLELRVPRWVAAVAVLLGIGLCGLVYRAGWSEGRAEQRRDFEARVAALGGAGAGAPIEVEGGPVEAAGGPAVAAAEPGPVLGPEEDPRRPGLNYWNLSKTDLPTAKQVSAFYNARGIRTFIRPDTGPGRQPLYWVNTYQGLAGSDRDRRDRLEVRVREIDALWRQLEGYPLSPYEQKYQPRR